jgi:hypothetical protein
MTRDFPILDFFLIQVLPPLLVLGAILLVAKSRSWTSGDSSTAIGKRGLTLVLVSLPIWFYIYLYIQSVHQVSGSATIPLGPYILYRVAVGVALCVSVIGIGGSIFAFTEWIRERLHG